MNRSLLLLPLSLAAACTTDPLNGHVVTGSLPGQAINFEGWVNQQNEFISVQVLKQPNLAGSDADWQQIGSAYSGTSGLPVGDPANPLYHWQVSAVPLPAASSRWQPGGVVKTRAVSTDSSGTKRTLTTFDEVTFDDCYDRELNQGADWETIGENCTGVGYGVTTLVSNSATPLAPAPGVAKPDWLGRTGDITDNDTFNYYVSWNAPQSLGFFRLIYGFNDATDPTATYYNDNDLGLGREMHCHKASTGEIACYVNNYSGAATAQFGNPVATVMADAETRHNSFATVAMVFKPAAGGNPSSVNFVVYNPSGGWQLEAQLDSTNKHHSIPNNCIECHGVDTFYNSSNFSFIGTGRPKFLPFDPQQYKYTTHAGFTLADQQESFRKLNQLVSQTSTTPAIADFITGIYAPSNVNTIGATANDTYVPDGWSTSTEAGASTYLGIVKVGCRTCHMSAGNAALDFLQSDDWSTSGGNGSIVQQIRNDICASGHAMPQAERAAFKLWNSGARGLLITGWPSTATPKDSLDACLP